MRLLLALARYPVLQRLLDLVRGLMPVLRVPFVGLAIVLRHDHVRAVLGSSRHFPVPWGWKMELVTREPETRAGGRNFVLGMKLPDEAYRQDYALLAHAFAYLDVKARVGARSAEATRAALERWKREADGAPFDVVEHLVLGVPARLCDTYYGIPIVDPIHFGKCTLAVSSFLFGPDFEPGPGDAGASPSMRMALDASAPMRRIIRRAMAQAKPAGKQHADPSPLERLMARPPNCGPLDDDRIHVQLFGMVMGFIPTNVLAAGNLLETLLAQPEFMARAVQAADSGDDERLWRCLRETLRFRNINLGPFRRCEEDFELANPGRRSTRIRAGTKVLACTQSAMFDERRVEHPHLFDSDRPDEDYLVFGVGQHWCIGAYIAIAQITQMFKVLLTQYEVRPIAGPEGRMRRFGVFPLHMNVKLSPR